MSEYQFMGAWGEVVIPFPLVPGKRVRFMQIIPHFRDDGLWTFVSWDVFGVIGLFVNEQGEKISVRVVVKISQG